MVLVLGKINIKSTKIEFSGRIVNLNQYLVSSYTKFRMTVPWGESLNSHVSLKMP
eukprot:SAG11_NODE_2360_length_3462_cov_2.125186_3_plen_55_part_00